MKTMILLMSCNQPLYREEEKVCRDTFIQDAEGAGLSYYFYKGLDEAHSAQCIDNETHTIYIDANDGLGGTGKKTIAALELSLAEDYDYLIKTNVSTYLNIGNIVKLIDTLPGRDDTNIYGARYIVNEYSRNIPFPRGFFAIYSRSVVKGAVGVGKLLVGKENMPKTDDTLMCLATLYSLSKELGVNYVSAIKEIPSVWFWSDEIWDSVEFDEALAIRCKDEENQLDTPENMRKLHAIVKGKEKPARKGYRPARYIETAYGTMLYENYLKLAKKIKALREKAKEGDQE